MSLKKEDIKVGDWFWSGNHNYPQQIKTLSFASDLDKDLSKQEDSIIINERLIFSFRMKGFSGYPIFRKWTPQPNEVCVFWNNGSNTRIMGEFLMTDKASGKHRAINNDFYDHVAPIAFDPRVYGLEG